MTLITDGFQRRAKLTIPAAQVGSGGVSNYSIVITEAVIGASHSFWGEVQANGGDLRASTDSGGNTRLALDIIHLDTSAKTCEINVGQVSLSSSSDNEFYLWWKHGTTQSQPAVGAAFGQYATYESANVARWDMGLTSGAVNDRTSNVNHGTRYGTGGANNLPQETIGKVRKALSFDGVDDYVQTSGAVNVSSFTLSAWVNNRTLAGYDRVINTRNVSNYSMLTSGTKLTYQINNSGHTNTSTTSLFTNTWQHIAIRYNSTTQTVNMYINGSQDATQVTGVAPPTASAIGYDIGYVIGFNQFWDGLLDDVRIYSRDLTAAGITTIFNNTNSPATFATLATADVISSGGPFPHFIRRSQQLSGGLVAC